MGKRKKKNKSGGKSRVSALKAITAPLGFFVLALLIVEGFLAAVLAAGNLDVSLQSWALGAGIGLFVFVVVIVAIFVWFKPENLTFDKDAYLSKRLPYMGMNQHVTNGMSVRIEPGTAKPETIQKFYLALAEVNRLLGEPGFKVVLPSNDHSNQKGTER